MISSTNKVAAEHFLLAIRMPAEMKAIGILSFLATRKLFDI